jgi:hypothetical protein
MTPTEKFLSDLTELVALARAVLTPKPLPVAGTALRMAALGAADDALQITRRALATGWIDEDERILLFQIAATLDHGGVLLPPGAGAAADRLVRGVMWDSPATLHALAGELRDALSVADLVPEGI